MLTRITLVVIAILVLGALAGCGDDDKGTNGKDNKIPSVLLATWTFQSATVDGFSVNPGSVLAWEPNTVSARITVNGDGSYLYEELDSDSTVVCTDTGIVEVDGNNFVITSTEFPINGGTWAVNGDELTLTVDMAGHLVEITATRMGA